MYYTLTDLRVYANQKRDLHPYFTPEINAILIFASDEIQAGENESQQVELAIDAIDDLLDGFHEYSD